TVAENAPLQPHETWLCLSDALDSVEYPRIAALSPVALLNQELVPRRSLRSRNRIRCLLSVSRRSAVAKPEPSSSSRIALLKTRSIANKSFSLNDLLRGKS
ncbi:hypothetical protein AMECASPLE_034221, partial [Ameca splendens]